MPIEHLPPRIRHPVERLRAGLMTDGTALVILGAGIIARGISYSSIAGPGPSGHPAESWIPMEWWSLVWVTVGVLCCAAATRPRSLLAALALGSGVALHILWGASFAWQALEDHNRSWVSSIGYFMISALVLWSVWRGSRTDIRLREGVPYGRSDDNRRGD